MEERGMSRSSILLTMRLRAILTALILPVVFTSAFGEVHLPAIYCDGVVLQRDMPIPVWGKATPGANITISMGKATTSANVSGDSCFYATLPPFGAGGPYTLTVDDRKVNDVLIGDVYLTSGQSNMEFELGRILDLFSDEVATYSNPNIREFKTARECGFHGPCTDTGKSVWKKATPGESENWAGITYFMGKELFANNGGIPVGIINSSWGGTNIEDWISADSIARYPERYIRYRLAQDDKYRQMVSDTEKRARKAWQRTLMETDNGYRNNLHWGDTELLSDNWGSDIYGKPINGSHWLSRYFDVPADKAGLAAELRLGCIVDADSVWINGHFVGTTTYKYPTRIYTIPSEVLKAGSNTITVRVVSKSDIPHVVPEKAYKIIYPDGSETSLEGTWQHALGSRMPQAPAATKWHHTPSVIYNRMIAPLARIPVRGVVWYQGESDIDIRHEYAELLKTLIRNWRDTFNNPTLPFYIIELADYLHPDDKAGRAAWQQMRDAQRQAADETENATWIRNGDVGEWNDLHPLDKKTPGTRVARAILNNR